MLYSDKINLFNGQFIAKCITQTCAEKYTYGHMGNKDSVKRERVMLPVTEAGEPDYQFMEDYVRELMDRKRNQYLAYLKANITNYDKMLTGGTRPPEKL